MAIETRETVTAQSIKERYLDDNFKQKSLTLSAMSNEIADARQLMVQITKCKDLQQAKDIAAAYIRNFVK